MTDQPPALPDPLPSGSEPRRGRLRGRSTRAARPHRGESGHELSALGGLAALSLDALSSVAYGPQAMMWVLILAGTGALSTVLPLTVTITAMLVLLVISYTQVIAAHPEGGGAYSVAKQDLGPIWSLLAAASVVVDYVLTVAVSLAAGAASLGSVFPSLAHHLLLVCLVGLVILTVINLFGIAVTGVEAISNGVPAFRKPRVGTAQRTEVSLGLLLGAMLIGLALLIRLHHVVPRGGVTVLAQLTAAAFGTGWPFYVSNLAVTLVLPLAANTSFGGLPEILHNQRGALLATTLRLRTDVIVATVPFRLHD